MFGRKDAHNSGERVDTIIGKETKFIGSLHTTGTIRIDGSFEGDIVTKGDILVGEGGLVKATINSRNCTIAGEVHGDIFAELKLEIAPTGKVYGNIVADNLMIGEGAVFRGTCEMKKSIPTDDAVAATKQYQLP